VTWLRQCRAVVRRDFLTDIRYPISFAFGFFDAVIALISYSFLAGVFGSSRPDGFEPLPFLLIGIALTDSVTTTLVTMALGVRNSQQAGTMKALLALPLAPARLMILSMAYPLMRGTFDFVVFSIAAFALGVGLTHANLPAVVLVFLLALVSALVIGLGSASFALVFKRGDPVLWAIGTATWLLSGVIYPTSVLSPWLRGLSRLLPTTHALAALRVAVIDGGAWAAIGPDVWALLAFHVIGIPLGLWLFTTAVTQARRSGTLGHL